MSSSTSSDLFGETSTADDPFASIGRDDDAEQAQETTTATSAAAMPAPAEAHTPTQDWFGSSNTNDDWLQSSSGAGTEPPAGETTPQLTQQSSWFDQSQQQHSGYDAYNGYDGHGQYDPSQHQYDPSQSQYGQYDPQQYSSNTSSSSNQYGQYAQHGQDYSSSQQYDQQAYGQYAAYDQYSHGQQGQYDQSQYGQQGQYDQQYDQQGQYGQQYDQSQYDSQYGQSQYDQQYAQQSQYDPQYDQSGQYTQSQYDQQYNSSQYDPQYDHYAADQQYHAQALASPYDPQPNTSSSLATAGTAYHPQTASEYAPSDTDQSYDYYDQPQPSHTTLPPASSPTTAIPPPPKGPPRGPSRNGAKSIPTPSQAQPPATPTQAQQPADAQPAPWDLPIDPSSSVSPPSAAPPPSMPASLSSAPSPVLHRQPTPRLTVTDEEGLEARPASVSSHEDTDQDDDLDEATRDFNDLKLGISGGKQKHKTASQQPEQPEEDDDPWFSGPAEQDPIPQEQTSLDSAPGAGDSIDTAAATAGGSPAVDTAANDDPWFANDDVEGTTETAGTAPPASSSSPAPPQRKYTHIHQISSVSKADDAWFASDDEGHEDDAAAKDTAADVDPDETLPASTTAFGEYHDDQQGEAGAIDQGYDPSKTAAAQDSSDSNTQNHDPYAYDHYAPSSTADTNTATSAPASVPFDPYTPSDQYDSYAPVQPAKEAEAATASAPAASSDAYFPYASNQQYDPYAPTSGGHAQHTSSVADSYDPYAPLESQASAPSSYDPYAPVEGQASATSSYNAYAPQSSHTQDTSTASAYDPYAPVQSQEQPHPTSSNAYDPYAPVEYAPQQDDSSYTQSSDNEATYKPSDYASKGVNGETTADQYGSSGHGTYDDKTIQSDPYASSQNEHTYSLYAPSQNSYAPSQYNEQHDSGYGSTSNGWGSSAEADPYGPAPPLSRLAPPSHGTEDDMEILDTPIAPHGLASPFGGATANGLSRGNTITQRSFSQTGGPQSRAVPSTAHDDYFSRPGSAAGAAGGLASPYDAPKSFDSDQLYHSQAVDPIEERRGAKIPVVTFGLDGKMAAFFPLQNDVSGSTSDAGPYGGYGSDVSQPTKIAVRQLSSLIPPTSFAASLDPLLFPGPALESAGNPGGAIARATGASGSAAATKQKKAALVKFLHTAAQDMAAGMSYRKRAPSLAEEAPDTSADRSVNADAQKTEDRIVLLRLLACVLEHDGNTVNNTAFDDAVRKLLTGDAAEETFAPANMPATSTSDNPALLTTQVTAGSLKQIQEYLMSGQRKEAVEFATRQKLWAHAMVIASAVDQATWRKVAQEFAQHEVLSAMMQQQQQQSSQGTGNIAGLKMMYDVFSGQDPTHIYHLFKPTEAGENDANTSNWKQSAAMIIANRCVGDSAALTAMGDGLLSRGLQEAAHVCYMLSPQTSTLGGADGPNVRLTLLGAHSPLASTDYTRDLDHLILSEVYEFSHSLVPTAKGQEPFPGLAYLQAYRLVHAYRLAELGETKRAQKYCEAIASVMKASKNSPYFHRVLVAQLKELSDRLVGGPQLDSGGNWVTRKMQRPTLDGMLSAFEGRFTKFIAGDDSNGGSPTQSARDGAYGSAGGAASTPGTAGRGGSASGGTVGAFSHYSAITPDAGSATISRVQSYADFSSGQSVGGSRPSSRAASVMGGGYQSRQQQDRGGSLMGYANGSPAYEPYSATSTNSDWEGGGGAAPYAAGGKGVEYSDGRYPSRPVSEAGAYDQEDEGEHGKESHDSAPAALSSGPQWGYDANSSDDAVGGRRPQFFSTPTGGGGGEIGDGLLSPMDTFFPTGSASGYSSPAAMPTFDRGSEQQQQKQHYNAAGDDEEDDDLGFGNSSTKKAGGGPAPGPSAAEQEAEKKRQQEQAEKDKKQSGAGDSGKHELKSSPSTSWLGRLWGRRDSSDSGSAEAKAKQAHMGEQSSFYYDTELKRWVNKKAGDSGSAAATPPPPPRATTASPSMASRSVSGPPSAGGQPMLNRSSTEGYGGGNGPPGPPSGMRSASATVHAHSYRGTPSIAEDRPLDLVTSPTAASAPVSAGSSPPMGSTRPPSAGPARTRSNLGDLNQPAAVQPPLMRPGSAAGNVGNVGMSVLTSDLNGVGGTPPPPSPRPGTGAGSKKKPLSKRYVRVD